MLVTLANDPCGTNLEEIDEIKNVRRSAHPYHAFPIITSRREKAEVQGKVPFHK